MATPHTHVDALCHISYGRLTYNGRPANEVVVVLSAGAIEQDITAYKTGVVGRGVLLDTPRLRNVEWLEPGEAVTRAELDECAALEDVTLEEGRYEFMVVGLPLRLPGGTGSPWNPIAICSGS